MLQNAEVKYEPTITECFAVSRDVTPARFSVVVQPKMWILTNMSGKMRPYKHQRLQHQNYKYTEKPDSHAKWRAAVRAKAKQECMQTSRYPYRVCRILCEQNTKIKRLWSLTSCSDAVSIGWMSRTREEIDGEGGAALQPRLHANLLYPAPGVSEPRGELSEIHPAVVSQVLLLCLGRIGIILMLFDPFH